MKRKWLDTRLVVYVPSTYYDKKISDREFNERIKETANYLTRLFKGTTRFRARGTYEGDKTKVVEERVSTIESYATKESWEKHRGEFYDWLHKKRVEWGQESLAFEKETDMTFIEEKKQAAGKTTGKEKPHKGQPRERREAQRKKPKGILGFLVE